MNDRIRVLYVDDDVSSLEIRGDLLEEEYGFDITAVTTVADAKEILESEEIDCVLSDYHMPDEDGIDFLIHVREQYDEALPFILFTANESEELARRAFDHGVTDYFPKSLSRISYDLLVERIKRVVAESRLVDQIEQLTDSLAEGQADAAAEFPKADRREMERTASDLLEHDIDLEDALSTVPTGEDRDDDALATALSGLADSTDDDEDPDLSALLADIEETAGDDTGARANSYLSLIRQALIEYVQTSKAGETPGDAATAPEEVTDDETGDSTDDRFEEFESLTDFEAEEVTDAESDQAPEGESAATMRVFREAITDYFESPPDTDVSEPDAFLEEEFINADDRVATEESAASAELVTDDEDERPKTADDFLSELTKGISAKEPDATSRWKGGTHGMAIEEDSWDDTVAAGARARVTGHRPRRASTRFGRSRPRGRHGSNELAELLHEREAGDEGGQDPMAMPEVNVSVDSRAEAAARSGEDRDRRRIERRRERRERDRRQSEVPRRRRQIVGPQFIYPAPYGERIAGDETKKQDGDEAETAESEETTADQEDSNGHDDDISKDELTAMIRDVVSEELKDKIGDLLQMQMAQETPEPESPPPAESPTESNPEPDEEPPEPSPSKDRERVAGSWDSAPAYERPDGLELVPGNSVLIKSNSQDPRHDVACRDMLESAEVEGWNAIVVRYRQMNADRLMAIADHLNQVKFISIGYHQPVPAGYEDQIDVLHINNSNDLTRLGIVVSGVLEKWSDEPVNTLFGLDSINILLQYKSGQSVFRFLHILLGRLKKSDVMTHMHIDPTANEMQEVNLLKPLFEEVMTIDSLGATLE